MLPRTEPTRDPVKLKLPTLRDATRSEPPDAKSRVRQSLVFDAVFYRNGAEAKGLKLAGLDPIEHYFQHGEAARVPPHPLFDPAYYAAKNPDVVAAGVNLLRHYLENGWRENRDPHPLVDLKLIRSQLGPEHDGDPLAAYLLSSGGQLRPHALVDAAHIAAQQRRLAPGDSRPALLFYLASDPEKINPAADFDGAGYRRLYPAAGAMNPLVHYALHGRNEGKRPPRDRGAVARVAPLIEAAGRLDPDIVRPFEDLAQTPVMHGYDMARREFRLYRLLVKAAGKRRFEHVILTPWLKRGGADRAVLHLARALLARDPACRVLIVCTQDNAVEALDWAPVSQRLRVAKVAGEVDDVHDTYVAFCNFLRFAGCARLYVVNSRFGWDLLVKYGATLKRIMKLYGFAFCQDYDDRGRRAGYAWTHLGRAFDQLDAVVSDNGRTFAEFAADHGFDAEDAAKYVALPLPVDEGLDGLAAETVARNLEAQATRRPRVFWAGRFSAQKALDVAAETARLLPEVDICAYGGAQAPEHAPGNLLACGDYDDFPDLPLHEAALFLHTARWEGLPNVLLEAGAAGLPIVARDIGGIGELVDATTGWLLPRDARPEAFAAAIRDALARPKEALARAGRMRERIRQRHNESAFAAALQGLLGSGA